MRASDLCAMISSKFKRVDTPNGVERSLSKVTFYFDVSGRSPWETSVSSSFRIGLTGTDDELVEI